MRVNSDELKQKYIDELGEEFELKEEFVSMFAAVEEEWGNVLYLYKEYMELFDDSDKVTLLNTLGPGIGYLQVLMGEALILGLCRLTDKYPNSASVLNLPKFICDNPDLKNDVQGHADEASEYAEEARKRRNKWIAHRDINRKANKVTFEEIKNGLDSVYEVLSAISVEYWKEGFGNKIISKNWSPMGTLVTQLDRLVEGMLFIDSFIDPNGETELLDEKINVAFLNRIGVDSITDQDKVKIGRIRLAAKFIREETSQKEE